MSFLNDNFISRFFVTVIEWFYSFTGDYIIAVLLFTILIKIILLPLDIKSKKSMMRMQAVQPKMAALQERYKNDPQKLNIATRELYKKENVSQMGGCLPLLIQFPILIAMFGAIRIMSYVKTVELVVGLGSDPTILPHSFLWVHNIWQPDTGIAEVMPSLSEFQLALQSVSTKLPADTLMTASNIINYSAIDSYTTAMQSIQSTTVLGDLFTKAYSTLPAESISMAAQVNYSSLIAPVLTHFEGYKNGFFLFPLLAGVGQYVSLWYNSKKAEKAGQKPQGMGMQLIMPAMIVYFACTTGTLFALYYMITSVWGLGQQLIMDLIMKNKSGESKDDKKALEKPAKK